MSELLFARGTHCQFEPLQIIPETKLRMISSLNLHKTLVPQKTLVPYSVANGGIPLASTNDNIPRPQVRGKFVFVGNDKFLIRGVTYGTFRPDENGID